MAVRFLRRQGYRILQRNYRCPAGEIDIVAADRDELVFVEVKARRSTAFGRPEEAVTPTKARQIRRAALSYCHRHGLTDPPCRCDVVAISFREDGAPQIEHFVNAFPLLA